MIYHDQEVSNILKNRHYIFEFGLKWSEYQVENSSKYHEDHYWDYLEVRDIHKKDNYQRRG